MALQASPTTAMQQAPGGAPAYQQAFPRTTSNPEDINTIVAGMVDRCPWRYYDVFNDPLTSPTTACPAQINYFQVAMNQQDPFTLLQKTKLDTNMDQGGQFSPPYCLVMEQIGFFIQSTDVKADIDKIFNSYYMEFKILGKIFFEGLLWMFPGGFGLSGTQNQQGTDQSWTNGMPAPQFGWRLGKYSRYIPPLTQFSVRLFCPGTTAVPVPTLSTNFKLYCYLDGLADRPVQ